MWLSMALWWLVPIAAIVLVVVWIGFRRRAESSSSAEEILKQRYARGEIDRAEYEQRRQDLRI